MSWSGGGAGVVSKGVFIRNHSRGSQDGAHSGSVAESVPRRRRRRRMSPHCLHVVVAISVPVNFCLGGKNFFTVEVFLICT